MIPVMQHSRAAKSLLISQMCHPPQNLQYQIGTSGGWRIKIGVPLMPYSPGDEFIYNFEVTGKSKSTER